MQIEHYPRLSVTGPMTLLHEHGAASAPTSTQAPGALNHHEALFMLHEEYIECNVHATSCMLVP